MIIPEYKALFVHVPKAAGQSVENFILSQFDKNRKEHGADYLLRYNDDPTKGPKRLAHLLASDYTQYGYISEALFESYYKFTIVRNPWSRMVSFYKFRGYSNLVSFSNFIKYYLPHCLENEHWFFRPQSDFIYNESNELLVDFVAKMEEINTDFAVIAKQLGIAFDTLPKNNHSAPKGLISAKSYKLIKKHPDILRRIQLKKSGKLHYREMYDAQSLKVVEKYYGRDIELLKYVY